MLNIYIVLTILPAIRHTVFCTNIYKIGIILIHTLFAEGISSTDLQGLVGTYKISQTTLLLSSCCNKTLYLILNNH